MSETPRRCDQCKHVDTLRGVHPMRCVSPALHQSLPVSVMRAEGGSCGPDGRLFEQKEVNHADHS